MLGDGVVRKPRRQRVREGACHLGDHLPRLPLEELRDLYQFS
jgi:hypothetical protein